MKIRQWLVLAICASGCLSSQALELDELEQEDVYLSPTRLKQSPHDIPASVSRIDQETIRQLQIQDVPDLLKYIAGMISADASGNQPRINYHGTNGLAPRRMQVLIDGTSVYRPSYAEVTWPTLPISIHDIDVIEVTRSPSAASYGANSMMAVINIQTKDPYDVDALGAIGSVGSQGYQASHFHSSRQVNERLRYRVSLSTQEDDGYDTNYAAEERRDGSDIVRANGKMAFSANAQTKGELFIGYSDAVTELEYRDGGQRTFPDMNTKSFFLSGDLGHSFSQDHEIKLATDYTRVEQNMEWNTCYPTVVFSQNLRALFLQNPDYAEMLAGLQIPTGGSVADDALRDALLAELAALGPAAFAPACGWVNENAVEHRVGIEVEDTYVASDQLRMVSGFGASRRSLDSETFLGGSVSSYAYRVFGNAEYRWGGFTFNLGAMVEDEDHLDEPAFSPRVGANYRLSETTSFRIILSKAARTPDIMEHARNWGYLARGLEPNYPLDGRTTAAFYFSSTADGELEPEKILARELSLYSNSLFALGRGTVNQTYDIKYFHNSLTNLISEKLQFFDYVPTNNGEVTLAGLELDANFTLREVILPEQVEAVKLHVNYAYMDSRTDEFYERSLHARHSGAAYAVINFQGGWLSSLAYHGNSEIQGESFDAWELGLGKEFATNGGQLSVKGRAVYQPDRVNSFVVDQTFRVQNINDDSLHFYLTLAYSFR